MFHVCFNQFHFLDVVVQKKICLFQISNEERAVNCPPVQVVITG
jgi:hypothetical protein